jgi:hypothetical protein
MRIEYAARQSLRMSKTGSISKVKFGLKPTQRLVQVVTKRGAPAGPLANAVAEKQLYASHYFETALDLSFCVRVMTIPRTLASI